MQIILSMILLLFACSCSISSKDPKISLDERLSQVRAQYIRLFKYEIAKKRTDSSETEMFLQYIKTETGQEPGLAQSFRVDMATGSSKNGYRFDEINLGGDSAIRFRNEEYFVDGVNVAMAPFVWNKCELVIDKRPDKPVYSWGKRWMDMGNEEAADSGQLLYLIHSVSYLRASTIRWRVSIDFGTAPIEAFKELMTALKEQGVTKVVVETSQNSK